jgi:hypothetical protein
MLIIEDPTVTVKCRTAMKALFLYKGIYAEYFTYIICTMLKMQRLVPIGNVVSEVMIKMLSVTYYDEDDRLTFGQLN